jgi:hypothetical protein
MAKGQFYSAFQKNIIKKYYENEETINTNKLGDLVSDIYLSTNKANQKILWEKAEKMLESVLAGKKELQARAKKAVLTKNIEELALIVGEIF